MIRLDPKTERLLNRLAKRKGRTKSGLGLSDASADVVGDHRGIVWGREGQFHV